MAGAIFNMSDAVRGMNVSNYLIKNAQIIGEPLYYDGNTNIRAYEINNVAMVIKQESSSGNVSGRIIGKDADIKGMAKLLDLDNFVMVANSPVTQR